MAKDRIVSGGVVEVDGQVAGHALRPERLGDYVGQRDLVEKLTIAIEAVKARGEALEHVLLHGPPGLGKTTLAHVIANEMSTRAYVTSGPALTKAGDLVGLLTKLQAGDVLFIDEIHRLTPAVEEYIYPAMEDFKIDLTVDSGMHAKVVPLTLRPFTLIGATTRAGLLSSPLRARFGLAHHLGYYNEEDLASILRRSAGLLGLDQVPESTITTIAARSRGTPRIANRLLRRVRDYAQVRGEGLLTPEILDAALQLEGVDSTGLDPLDRAYLRAILSPYQGGPVGLEAIAATMGEDSGTLEGVVEPYLLQMGLVARTRQGRRLTEAGASHIGAPWPLPGVAEGVASSNLFG